MKKGAGRRAVMWEAGAGAMGFPGGGRTTAGKGKEFSLQPPEGMQPC